MINVKEPTVGATFDKLTTYKSLGVVNLLRVMSYRLGLRYQVHPVQKVQAAFGSGPLWDFSAQTESHIDSPSTFHPLLFSKFPLDLAKTNTPVPDWHRNQLTGYCMKNADRPWWLISDFSTEVGDIKTVWELSRMDWAPTLALAAKRGSRQSLIQLNQWVLDWCQKNPPYLGPNWKCGQEASLRLINIAISSFFLEQWQSCSANLQQFVEAHLRRIAPSVSYAIAQDNNHGTSEAVGLYIGGSWLKRLGRSQGTYWQKLGARLLDNRVARLIGRDGTFSQYSTNYHRLMLDTLSLAEFWRRLLDQPRFSTQFYAQAEKATHWLYRMVDSHAGDAPNTGANDGARFFHFLKTDYRDFRPSVQLAVALFSKSLAYSDCDSADQLLANLKIEKPDEELRIERSFDAQDGGFAVLQNDSSKLLFRYPRFRYRPSHCDALHVDLFVHGRNILRDAGTYSYSSDQAIYDQLRGTAGHNTIQFDARDQMPKISRFLYGSWLRTIDKLPLLLSENAQSIEAGYRDYCGAQHHRAVKLLSRSLIVSDTTRGSFKEAVLRWRLFPSEWTIAQKANSRITIEWQSDPGLRLIVNCSQPWDSCQLTEGRESRSYFELTNCPILELRFSTPCQLETTLEW